MVGAAVPRGSLSPRLGIALISFLDSARQPTHEVALEGQKDDQHRHKRDQHPRRKAGQVEAVRALEMQHAHGQVLEVRLAQREHQRDGEIVPVVDELKDHDHGDDRPRQGQHQPERLQETRPVDPGRVEQVLRQVLEEASEQKDVEGAGAARLRQDHSEPGVEQAEMLDQYELRDEDRYHRHEEREDDHAIEEISAREAVARENVTAKGGFRELDERRSARVEHRVDEVAAEARRHPRAFEVVEVERLWQQPGAGGERSQLRLESRRYGPEERIGPDQADDQKPGQRDQVEIHVASQSRAAAQDGRTARNDRHQTRYSRRTRSAPRAIAACPVTNTNARTAKRRAAADPYPYRNGASLNASL